MGNTANVPANLALAQRRLGHDAQVVAVQADRFQREADRVLTGSGPIGWNLAMRRLAVEWNRLDAVHIHGGIWRSQLFYYGLRRRTQGASWIVHLHGSETRTGKGLHHLRLADRILCATPDLRRVVPEATWLPNPVPSPPTIPTRQNRDGVTFGHFPSDPGVKGTAAIQRAFRAAFGAPDSVEQVRDSVVRCSWPKVHFLVADRIDHDEVLRLMGECDAVVDHLSMLGPVSLVALEAMALGRAALSSFDADAYPPDCPVIPLRLETAARVLTEVVEESERLATAGKAGRKYVMTHHDPQTVASRLISIYQEAPSNNRG